MLQIIFVEIYSVVLISLVVEIGIELSMIVIEITRFEVSFTVAYKGLYEGICLRYRRVEITELLILLYNVLFYDRLLSSLFLNCESLTGSCGV